MLTKLSVNTSKHTQMLNITDMIQKVVEDSGVRSGVCTVFLPHTTAAVTINENGTKVKIRTVGDKWSLLQRYKFGANAQPFYVIVNSKGQLKAGPYTFDTDAEKFLEFLK